MMAKIVKLFCFSRCWKRTDHEKVKRGRYTYFICTQCGAETRKS